MADNLGTTIIGLFFGLTGIIPLLFVLSNIPTITTNSAQSAANVANYTRQVTQAFVEYSMPWWFPLLGFGALGVFAIIALVLVFGKGVLDG